MRTMVGVLALVATSLATPGAARGAEPVWVVVAPPRVRPLSVVRVEVVRLNPAFGEAVLEEPEPSLAATFRTGKEEHPVALLATADAAPMTVEPRGFATRTYSLTVPDAPEEDATLVVTLGGRQIAAATRVAREDVPPASDPIPRLPAVQAFARTVPNRLSLYQPNYFVYGAGGEPEAKFQFSLKYRLLTFGQGRPGRLPASLQLAYTQRSLWDTGKPSEPFYDTSYMPEVFVEGLAPAREAWRAVSFLGWASGWRHESNGRDGDDSRSWDVLYARAGFAFGSPDRWFLAVVPEVWQRVGPADHMADIERYRGRGRIHSVVGRGTGPSLSSTLTPDQDLEHLSYQLDLSVPISLRRPGFAAYFLVQYFDGYAESIRNHAHESQTVRAGFSLVR